MPDTAALPEARKKPSKKLIGELLKSQRGLCATCPTVLAKINNGMVFICAPFDVDHAQALDHLGSNDAENLRCLCKPCHTEKTKRDVKASAKGRRVRKDVDRHQLRMENKARLSREVYKRQRREEAKLVSRSTFDQPPLPNIKARISKSPGSITSGGVSVLSKKHPNYKRPKWPTRKA